MRNKRLVWLLVLGMTLSSASPATVFASAELDEEPVIMNEVEDDTEAAAEVETAEPETSAAAENEESSGLDDVIVETVETLEEESTEETAMTNEELIAMQNIVTPEVVSLDPDFRFTYDEDAVQVMLAAGTTIYEGKSESSRAVGRSFIGSVAYVLADEGQSWTYVESGRVRGFVKSSDLTGGAAAGCEDAFALVSPVHNGAVEYTTTTAYNPVVDAEMLAASGSVTIYGEKSITNELSQVVGTLADGGAAAVLAQCGDGVIYVESGDVRGFAAAASFGGSAGNGTGRAVAQKTVSPEKNPALRYTVTSTQKANAEAELREAIVTFAKQNVQMSVADVYRAFGYELPETLEEQAVYGMQIPVDCAMEGDLIFYAVDGVLVSAAVYSGVIEENAVWATRFIG